MVGLRRSLRNAMSALANRCAFLLLYRVNGLIHPICSFPDIKHVKMRAGEVDIWQPKHLQLESLGILRTFSEVQDLQNTDPDMEALQTLLGGSELEDCHMQINLDCSFYESNSTTTLDNHQDREDTSEEVTDSEDNVVLTAR